MTIVREKKIVHKKVADDMEKRKIKHPEKNNLLYGYTMLKLQLEVTIQIRDPLRYHSPFCKIIDSKCSCRKKKKKKSIKD